MERASINSGPILGFQNQAEQTEYIVQVISHLEAISGRKLADAIQARSWMEKLRKYPKWKISELGEYSGPMNHKVFEYLDALHTAPRSVREDLGYTQIPEEAQSLEPQRVQIARDFNEHVQKYCRGIGEWINRKVTDEERRKRLTDELSSYRELDKKWPHLGVLNHVKLEKRFEGIV